ncbi:MAG: helix-turn-helix transcriptional regulator [Bdellovibrionaceae bacterium]|nr:helix-turn-helix transcriptional regulator [Pseudobdellovibrionaceae bacterium]
MLRDILIQKGLSNREAEVAELVSKGLSNKEVANQLFVTEKTVKFHLTNIYKKMNVKSRAQLIVWCLPHLGFVENEARMEARNTTAAAAYSAPVQTIPVGNANITTTLPVSNNGGIDRGSKNDAGVGI